MSSNKDIKKIDPKNSHIGSVKSGPKQKNQENEQDINSKKNKSKSNKKNISKKIKNQKGSGLSDVYSSDDYKDVGSLDFMKFRTDDSRIGRSDPPAFPPCTIL
jgi:hypothetical protein